ncbi:MAG: hypothetical protein GEV10_31700 [Streptosporangiales bacterium]|nr:hypothetical protein [Streptosporangiales bacterium]
MSNTTTKARPAVSVDELRRAWAAVQAGHFRRGAGRDLTQAPRIGTPDAGGWRPAAGEQIIAVLGCAGSVGASTVALAVGLAAPSPVRVVECCSVNASGLAAASTAELGLHPAGWRQGRREHVLLERVSEVLVHIDEVPLPTNADQDKQLTILDAGWQVSQLLATPCWLSGAIQSADAVVLVTTATVPGMRRLESALELFANDRARVAVVGPRRKRWPKGVELSAGSATHRVLAGQRWVEIPEDRALAITGLDSRPIPDAVVEAGRRLLDHLPRPDAGEDTWHSEGTPTWNR